MWIADITLWGFNGSGEWLVASGEKKSGRVEEWKSSRVEEQRKGAKG
jgi:hypothetical protein